MQCWDNNILPLRKYVLCIRLVETVTGSAARWLRRCTGIMKRAAVA